NEYGQCEVSSWTNLTDIVTGTDHTVGIHEDGTLSVVGVEIMVISGEGFRVSLDDWTDIRVK
ncbi:MAG: hypothetical protein R3Y07_08245, partial [Eubacteriales bacterium]